MGRQLGAAAPYPYIVTINHVPPHVGERGNYQESINSPIITTGNELVKEQIVDFSKQLNMKELYSYIFEVKDSTEKIINSLSYDQLKKKVPEERKEHL